MTEYSHRCATASDIPAIWNMEREVWGEDGASEENIASRINIFPEGSIVVLGQSGIIQAYCVVFMTTSKAVFAKGADWDSITGAGSISTHNPKGDVVYGVNVTAREGSGTKEATSIAIRLGQAVMVNANKSSLLFGARMPGYAQWLDKNPAGDPHEYLGLHQRRVSRDPLLNHFEQAGFVPQFVMEDYFHCPDSKNNGVLVRLQNTERGVPLSRFCGGE